MDRATDKNCMWLSREPVTKPAVIVAGFLHLCTTDESQPTLEAEQTYYVGLAT